MLTVPLNNNGVAGTYYALARKGASVWNGAAWVAWVDASIATYAITATSVGAGDYTADVPADSDRVYLVRQAGGAPAIGDLPGVWVHDVVAAANVDTSGLQASIDKAVKLLESR